MSIAIASLLSLCSALIVALASHLFSVRKKQCDQLIETRLKAYTDFINTTSYLVASRRIGKTEDDLEKLAALNDAKIRICLCAEKPVVEALVEFWNAGATLEDELGVITFKSLCLRIRESLSDEWKDIADLPISDTLFKLEPSNFSYRAKRINASKANNAN